MGLVPEGHRFKGTYLDYEPIDYVMISTLYFDWALRHDKEGKIYAFAPFYWDSCCGFTGINEEPQLRELLAALVVEYPRCQN